MVLGTNRDLKGASQTVTLTLTGRPWTILIALKFGAKYVLYPVVICFLF